MSLAACGDSRFSHAIPRWRSHRSPFKVHGENPTKFSIRSECSKNVIKYVIDTLVTIIVQYQANKIIIWKYKMYRYTLVAGSYT